MKFTFPPDARPLSGYTLKRGIARGGFGEVYYALTDSGKEVALKLLQQNLDVELRGVSQCLNLKHPNLVTLFDIRADADGDHWVVMEYVSGQTLEQVLSAHPGGLSLPEVERWLAGAASGLAHLHERGLVHRDVKPGNIFHDQQTVKVGDVGLSKFVHPSKRSAHTESVGTVYYMAPEVAHGRYGPEVDVYSLGVILYEMLTGRVPFDGETTGEILMKHLSQPADLSPLPSTLRPVVARALEKDPKKRTRTVTQLVDEFRRAVIGRDAPLEIPASSFYPRSTQPRATPPAGGAAALAAPMLSPWALFEKHPVLTAAGAAGLLMLLGTSRVGPRSMGLILTYLMLWSVIYALGWFCVSTARQLFRTSEPLNPPRPVPRPGNVPVTLLRPGRAVAQGHDAAYYRGLRCDPYTPRSRVLPLNVREAVSSMSWAVPATAGVTALAAVFSPLFGEVPLTNEPGRIGLFALTTLVASWGLLILAKTFEGRPASGRLRGVLQAALGAGVGAWAFFLDQNLLVQLNHGLISDRSLFTQIGAHPLMSESFQPTLAGYVTFFAVLFGVRRWWFHSDSFRPKPFRFMSLLLTAAVGFVIPMIWTFPQAWGATWAAAICAVVQWSAVWTPPQSRVAMMQEGGAEHA